MRERTAKVDQRRAALLQANKECEQKLLDALQVTVPTSGRVEDSTLKHFAKLLKGQLVAFIHTRKYKDIHCDKWPNKWTLAEAETGFENLIEVAFDVRASPLLLGEIITTEPDSALPTMFNATVSTSSTTDYLSSRMTG